MGNSMPIRDMDIFATYQRPSSGALAGAGRPAVPSQGSVQVSPDTSLQLSHLGWQLRPLRALEAPFL